MVSNNSAVVCSAIAEASGREACYVALGTVCDVPILDDTADTGDVDEQVLDQAFVAETTVKTLHIGIL